MSGSEERDDVLRAVATGLSGYVPKSLPDEENVGALEAILEGRMYVPRFMTAHGSSSGGKSSSSDRSEVKGGPGGGAVTKPISPRQRDVLDCVRRGLSNKEIARELDIAEGTVKIHLAALFSHFGARNRTELATRS